jgi:hypothetical protein
MRTVFAFRYFVRGPASENGSVHIYSSGHEDPDDEFFGWSFEAELTQELSGGYYDTHPTVWTGGPISSSSRAISREPLGSGPHAPTAPQMVLSSRDGPRDQRPFCQLSSDLVDGTELYFSSPRPGGEGGHDLYVATRRLIQQGR